MTTQTSTTTIAPVSEETKALVEQKMVGEPDAIKQKMGELIELIKDRAAAELHDAEGMTREAYVKAMTQAKGTLKKTELFFQEQEQSLDQSIKDFTTEATEKWDKFVSDLRVASNRVDRAVDAAWKTLTEETPSV
ncbi:MAG: hypothetical protein F6K11_23450 [Leptolyngbya sp. SIO3F4]|nr:hypothetical protein [Leptolyngbya sp. SIO3F4]